MGRTTNGGITVCIAREGQVQCLAITPDEAKDLKFWVVASEPVYP